MIELTAWVVVDANSQPYHFTMQPSRRESIRFFIDDYPDGTRTTWRQCRRRGYRCVRLYCKEWGKT